MIRSSGISSGAADSVVVQSSNPFQAAIYPCFQRGVACHQVTGRVAVAHGRQGQGSGRFGGVDKKAAGTSSWLGAAARRKAREGP